MRRLFAILIALLIALPTMAQTQRVVVKTPGRQQDDGSITKGKPIAEAYVSVQDGNTYESDDSGELRIAKPASGRYYFSDVRKTGYSLSDADFLSREYTYSPSNALYIAMDSDEQMQALRRKIESKVRRNYMVQLQAKSDEVERLQEEGDAAREEILRLQGEIDAAWDNLEKEVEDKARTYLSIDFDLTDDFKSEISYYIINGKLQKADSMLATRGDLAERIDRNIQLQKQVTREQSALAEECLYKHDICRQRLQADSAAYWLERRAELDQENVEWQIELAEYIRDYLADYNRALEILNKVKDLFDSTDNTFGLERMNLYDDIALCYICLGDNQKLVRMHIYSGTSYLFYGMSCFDNADYEKALEFFIMASANLEERYGTEHPLTAVLHTYFGKCYMAMCDYDTALEYFNKASTICEKVLGARHHVTAKSYSDIGACYYAKGNHQTAWEYYNTAIKIQEKALDIASADTAITYDRIGEYYCYFGNYDTALDFYNKALTLREKYFGVNHSETAISFENIGNCYKCCGNYEKALEYHSKAMTIREKSIKTAPVKIMFKNYVNDVTFREKEYGTIYKQQQIALSCNNIASCYLGLGEYDTASEYLDKALKIRKRGLGVKHPVTAETIANIGMYYRYLGNDAKALRHLRKAHKILLNSYPAEHPSLVSISKEIEAIEAK